MKSVERTDECRDVKYQRPDKRELVQSVRAQLKAKNCDGSIAAIRSQQHQSHTDKGNQQRHVASGIDGRQR